MNSKERQVFNEIQNTLTHVGMMSTYLMLVDGLKESDVLFLQHKYKKPRSFFLTPFDVEEGFVSNTEIDEMIDYFVEQEDYRKCAKLKNIKL
tara:strand:+ start:49 stop:324 length:276 start_codon:yes stop_codon:yes gene_type:complete